MRSCQVRQPSSARKARARTSTLERRAFHQARMVPLVRYKQAIELGRRSQLCRVVLLYAVLEVLMQLMNALGARECGRRLDADGRHIR